MKIYIASKVSHASRWRALRDSGVPICSTWIDEADGGNIDWETLWDRCLYEASTADALIVYVEPGEVLNGALVEAGAALSHGVPVYWVGPVCTTVVHTRRVAMANSVEAALRMLGAM